MAWFRCLLVALVLGMATLPAIAQTDDAFAGLASDDFDTIGAAITALAFSGNKQAAPTIRALQADALYATQDDTLLIKSDTDYRNARTNAVVADVDEDALTAVKVNNRVRRAEKNSRARPASTAKTVSVIAPVIMKVTPSSATCEK